MTRPARGLSAETIRSLLVDTSPYLSCDDCFAHLDEYIERDPRGPHQDAAMQAHLTGCGACEGGAETLRGLLSQPAGWFRSMSHQDRLIELPRAFSSLGWAIGCSGRRLLLVTVGPYYSVCSTAGPGSLSCPSPWSCGEYPSRVSPCGRPGPPLLRRWSLPGSCARSTFRTCAKVILGRDRRAG